MQKKKPKELLDKRGKRKRSKAHLSNLTPGWNRVKKLAAPPKLKSRGTSMQGDGYYINKNPSPTTLTLTDKLQDKVLDAIERTDSARCLKKTRTQEECIMLIQFVARCLQKYKCTLTTAVYEAADTFHWDHQDIYRMMNAYFDDESGSALPELKNVKK